MKQRDNHDASIAEMNRQALAAMRSVMTSISLPRYVLESLVDPALGAFTDASDKCLLCGKDIWTETNHARGCPVRVVQETLRGEGDYGMTETGHEGYGLFAGMTAGDTIG